MEKVLKNKDKYRLIKLAKGMSLETFKAVNRSGTKGVSTAKFGSKWFVTPQGRVLFKDYDTEHEGLRIINELLYDNLAKQIGLPVAQYLPAEYKPSALNTTKEKTSKVEAFHGLASVNVAKRGEKIFDGAQLLDYDDFCGHETFVDYVKALDIFEDGEGYYVDKKNIKSTLFKMMLLDALTFMEDRNVYNVSFIKNDADGYLVACPVIDNEMCFAGKNLWFNQKGIPADADLKTFLKMHGDEMRLVANDSARVAPAEDKYMSNVKEIVKLASKNKKIQNFVTRALNTLNIDEAFLQVEQMGYKVTPEYKEYVSDLINLSKGIFKKYMNEFMPHNTSDCLPEEE